LQQLQQLPAWLAGFLQAPAATAAADTGNKAAPALAGPVAISSSSSRARFPPALRQQQQLQQQLQQQQRDDASLSIASSSGVQLLGEMLNLKSTFPMLLHTVSNSSSSSSAATADSSTAAAAGHNGSSSSFSGRPQQLLTVGCRNWGNWWDGRGLLRVKIYDFAIYVDGEQVRAWPLKYIQAEIDTSGEKSPSQGTSS
jgi:hypothetical protein